MRRVLALVVVMAVVAVACGDSGGGSLPTGGESTTVPPTASTIPGTAVAPDYVLVDEDPDSPVSLVVGFADNEEGLESMVVLGDKIPTDRPPEGILLYFADESNPLDMGFDEEGRLEWMIAPDGSEIRVLSYEGTQATVVATGPDGSSEVVTVDVPEIDPDGLLDTYAAGAGVNAVPAAYAADESGGRRSELPTVLVTAAGSYSVNVADGGPAESDILLRPGECTIPEMVDVAGISRGRFVTCSTAIGRDEVIVRTTVDVWDFYGVDLPTFHPLPRGKCLANTFLLLVVSLVMLAAGIGSGVVALVAAGIPGIGWAVALLGAGAAVTSTALSGFLYWLAKEFCIQAKFHGDELRRDVEQRLQDLEATVTYTPILLTDAASYEAAADPPQLVFRPFATDRLDPITVTVVAADDDGDEPDVQPFPWTFSGPVTSHHTVGAPSPLEFSYTFEATITLFEDGTVEYSNLLPAGRQGLTVDCTSDTAYVSTDFPEGGGSWQGEHKDGEFKLKITDTLVREGTYTQEELHYEVLLESDFAVCDGKVGVTLTRVEDAYLPRTAP